MYTIGQQSATIISDLHAACIKSKFMVSPSNQSSILLLKESRFPKDQPQQQE